MNRLPGFTPLGEIAPMKTQGLPGFRDFYPEETAHRNHIFPYQVLNLFRPPLEVMVDREPAEGPLDLLRGLPYARGNYDPEWEDLPNRRGWA